MVWCCRYWVSHEAGIHAVTLPLVENFIQFSEMADGKYLMIIGCYSYCLHFKNSSFYTDIEYFLSRICQWTKGFAFTITDAEFSEQECESLVEHLICTRSLTPAAPMPVAGVVSGSAHSMLALLASGRIIALSLPTIYNRKLFELGLSNSNMPISPLRKVSDIVEAVKVRF